MTKPTESSPKRRGAGLNRRDFMIGGGAALGGAALLAACGDDDGGTTATTTTAAPTTTADTGPGSTTLGSNFSGEVPKAALAAAVAATGVETTINTIDHNTYQDNFNTYIQQPDDVVSWFAGYRMRAFAGKGVLGDISDVWSGLSGMSDGFRSASTALDGKQYFVPFYFYPWAVHYRKSLFADMGYSIPTTWGEFKALCDTMEGDGVIPLCAANDGRWPQMGMFDMINLRVNGYDYHVSLMGGNESWESAEVKNVFSTWEEILPYYQPDANGRAWEDSAVALGDKSAGMFLIGTFLADQYPAGEEIFEDLDFFLFPEINAEHGQDAIEAPIDGFMMAASPENETGAKALLGGLGSAPAIDAFLDVNPSVVAANSNANTSGYNSLQQSSATAVGSAKQIAQFLDRDTDPDFAAQVVGTGIADFLTSPGSIDTILADIEAKKQTFTFE
ncbi:MAG: carbohydrate ABC transporter substrate-binding protein [Acidimicrobiaceae bacterium]|nr:ABC transporter substrate-binding protein [Acidimicrobiaceae bacterium]MXW61671.1 carbohydrate ABC transporter substrate-binding protein [Acidimicrobiaceae bacterium]MXW77133.1 carbohydrate ABC transporter substrate-binding protein [Acidimicrobiaceae bacterium]MYC42747.1 carbohydrate ABC transporter substrate-binding protein [Acidimicrobiaceae bacterium]MYD06394.1 carbohydrate ABC transporter substrate-binding protein [Acidimicrobiaceae bacterium]